MTDAARYSYKGASTLPQCALCGRDANPPIIRGHSVYCSDNCGMHDWAKRIVAQLGRTIERGGGGSPVGLLTARNLLSDLERLKPVRPGQYNCEQCWALTNPATTVVDGETRQVRRCGMCGWEGKAS